MKRLLFLVAPLALVSSTVVHAQSEYDWTGGSPGYSGALVLDSDANDDGSLSDILSLTITTPDGTFDFSDATASNLNQSPFSWDPTEVTSMWITWSDAEQDSLAVGQNVNFTGLNFVGSGDYNYDFAGSWTAAPAASPDVASSAGLFSGALALLIWIRRRAGVDRASYPA